MIDWIDSAFPFRPAARGSERVAGPVLAHHSPASGSPFPPDAGSSLPACSPSGQHDTVIIPAGDRVDAEPDHSATGKGARIGEG